MTEKNINNIEGRNIEVRLGDSKGKSNDVGVIRSKWVGVSAAVTHATRRTVPGRKRGVRRGRHAMAPVAVDSAGHRANVYR